MEKRLAIRDALARPVLRETLWMVVIGALDLVYTIYAVRMGWAKEANPVMASILEHSDRLFIAVKGASFLVPLAILESMRSFYLDMIQRAVRACFYGYLTLYIFGSLLLLHRPL
jgi:hypothetical protein